MYGGGGGRERKRISISEKRSDMGKHRRKKLGSSLNISLDNKPNSFDSLPLLTSLELYLLYSLIVFREN